MKTDPEALIRQLFTVLEARDLPAALAMFSDDAVIYDPHYPIPTMKGTAAIERGLTWGLGTLSQMGFTVNRVWVDGTHCAVEVDTHHVLNNGMKLDFEQVFLFETQGDRITHLRSFVPYPPPGIGGWISTVTGWWWKLRG